MPPGNQRFDSESSQIRTEPTVLVGQPNPASTSVQPYGFTSRYLNLLQQRRRWSQDQIRRYVNQYVDTNAKVNKTSDEDAGTTTYGRLSALGLDTLRLAIAKLLEERN